MNRNTSFCILNKNKIRTWTGNQMNKWILCTDKFYVKTKPAFACIIQHWIPLRVKGVHGSRILHHMRKSKFSRLFHEVQFMSMLIWIFLIVFDIVVPHNIRSRNSIRTFIALWPSDDIWWHTSGSTLVRAKSGCLVAPSYYQNWSPLRSRWIQLRAIPQKMMK